MDCKHICTRSLAHSNTKVVLVAADKSGLMRWALVVREEDRLVTVPIDYCPFCGAGLK